MPKYCATFRAMFGADDDVMANVVADQIRLNAEQDLEEDEGDTFECTQVTSAALNLTPDELLQQFRKTRNLLIQTRMRPCWELGKELDRMIYALQHKDDPRFTLSTYDHGTYMELTERILVKGEEPDVTQ